LNVIVDSSALPTGAATLVEQQTQTTALQLIDNLPVAQASTTASQNGALVQGAVTTGAPTYTTAQTNPLSLTTAGLLRVDGSGVTNPISGTVTANAGTGTFTVGDGAGALNVIVDSGTTAVTQATASSLNAEVQGDAASGAAKSGNPVQIGGVFNTTQPTVTTGQAVEAQSTARGAQIVATGVDAFTVGGTVTANAGSGTFVVGDGAGALNVIVDSGTTTVTQATPTNLNAAVVGTGTAGAPAGNILTVQGVASMTKLLVTPDSVALPANQSVNLAQRGGSAIVADPCMREARIPISISQTSGTQIITGTASERIFICSLHIVTATAQNIALVSGTVTVCATSTSGVSGFGGATAATGWNFSANGGIQMGSSEWSYGKTDTDGDNVCLFQSGSGQVSGGLTYVSAPNF
jgi:hypothetical protein